MNFWEFAGDYWWLVFPLGAVFGGVISNWSKAMSKWGDRRRKHRLEMAKIKYGAKVQAGAPEGPAESPKASAQQSASELKRITREHDAIEQRWLSYELDLGKLIDFPVMSDMREAVTVDFHKAKRHADHLRPEEGEKPDAHQLAAYREAVRECSVAFEVAEREAKRRRATDFTPNERQTLDRAKKLLALAEDSGASHHERQQAYKRAQHELTGLISVPDAADEALRQRIAGALDAPRS